MASQRISKEVEAPTACAAQAPHPQSVPSRFVRIPTAVIPTQRWQALAQSTVVSAAGIAVLWRCGPPIWNLARTVGSSEPLVTQACFIVALLLSTAPTAMALFPILVLWQQRETPHLIRRRARLQAVAERPDALARTPHRVIEALWQKPRLFGIHGMVLSRLRPGQIVRMHSIRRESLSVIPPQSSFEPLALGGSDDAVRLLNQMAGRESESDNTARARKRRRPLRWTPARIAVWVVLFVGAAWVLNLSARLTQLYPRSTPPPRTRGVGTRYPSSRELMMFSMCGILFLTLIAVLLFWKTTWYILPGALLRRRYRVWRRIDDIRLFRRWETPVLLADFVYVLDSGSLVVLKCSEQLRGPIAAAWLSDARTPTLDELRAYFSAERAEMGGRRSVV